MKSSSSDHISHMACEDQLLEDPGLRGFLLKDFLLPTLECDFVLGVFLALGFQ